VWHEHRSELAQLSQQIHDYGLGLSAIMVNLISDRPGELLQIARRFGVGSRRLLSSRSDRNAKRTADYPRSLVFDELRGFMQGPVAVHRSRRAAQNRPELPALATTGAAS
jgi:hypothetical protein